MSGLSGFNPALIGADTANMAAGAETSLLDNATNFAGAAALSGVASIYNTFAPLVGGEKFDVLRWMNENDQHMGAYYEQNKGLVDTAGFIGTSILPGGLALKGLSLARQGIIGGSFARSTFGYMSTRQQTYLDAALKELAVDGGSVFANINRNKLLAAFWATADQAINVAAFETAVALTMKASPLLEKDEWSDVAKHIALTSVAFGGLGGAIEVIAMNGIYRSAVKAVAAKQNDYRALELLQGDLAAGDKAYGLAKSILDLPGVGTDVPFSYTLGGKKVDITLDTKKLFEKTLTSTERRGWEEFTLQLNKAAGGDAEVGNSVAGFIVRRIDEMKQAGASKDDILEALQDNLLAVKNFRRVSADAPRDVSDMFYVRESLDKETIGTIKSVDDLLKVLTNRAPSGNDVSRFPYQVKGNINDAKFGLVGDGTPGVAGFPRYATRNDAFADGVDAVMEGATLRINPQSTIFRKVRDPIWEPKSFFNTRTGAYTEKVFPTVADISTTTNKLSIHGPTNTLTSGTFSKVMPMTDEFALGGMDTLDASARYVWAEQLKVMPERVMQTDLPLLERIAQDGAALYKDTVLVDSTGATRRVGDIADFPAFLQEQKLAVLQRHLAENGSEDVMSLAVKLNVEPDWIARAITNNFVSSPELGKGVSILLSRSLEPQNIEVVWDFASTAKIGKDLMGKGGVETEIATTGRILKPGDGKTMAQALPDGAGNTIYGDMAFAYRAKVAEDQYITAATAVLGPDATSKLLPMSADVASKLIDESGVGASVLGFSNANYGDKLGLWSQFTGTQVHLLAQNAANATLTRLQPLMQKIKDSPEAAAELGVLTAALRRSGEKFVVEAAPEGAARRLINLEAAEFSQAVGGYVPIPEKMAQLAAAKRTTEFTVKNEDTFNFLTQSMAANAERQDKTKTLFGALGWNHNVNKDVVYVPPVDTSRYPFFAFVRQREGTLNGSSEVVMITARNEAELRKLADQVPSQYEVIFKQDTERFFKAKGVYDYSLTIKEPRIQNDLQRVGKMGDFYPETRAENILDDYITWHQREETKLVRRAVETRYAQTFAEIRAIGDEYEKVATSQAKGMFEKFRSQIDNPFNNYIKTALDISKRSEYTLLHEANEFAESLGRTAYRVFGVNYEKAMKGSVSWEEANAIASRYGIKGPYENEIAYQLANAPAEKSLVTEFVSKANMLLVNFTLRLDVANSIVNTISTPILLATEMQSIKSLIKNDPELVGKLAELRSIAVPGTDGAARVPSTVGLIAGAIKNFMGPEKQALLKKYKDVGAIRDTLSQYHDMIDDLSYRPFESASKMKQLADAAIEKGAKLTANEFSEEFTRFVSADVMRQLTDPIVSKGLMSGAEQNAYISVFVNRVQGNYISSQRPIAFQGVLGSAISLFQTYQFNLLQQLGRHIENRDAKTLFTLAGMQAGVYGLNGVPFFEAINTHLIGNSSLNPQHKDVYSTAPQLLKKEYGDWLMYGTASAFPLFSSNMPSLYTRGDINPRHPTILPISPMDVPAVDASIRFVGNLVDVGKKLVKGADISNTLLEGLEHNGINRPLAGIAQSFAGASTTSKGSLIAAQNDFSAIATMSRVIGAKPMDESLALNAKFRQAAYQAADTERLELLGEVVKTKLRGNRFLTDQELQDFQLDYAKAGGRIENYSKALQRWSRDANVSVVNQMMQQHNTSYSRNMVQIMGGEMLSDFRTLQQSSLGESQ